MSADQTPPKPPSGPTGKPARRVWRNRLLKLGFSVLFTLVLLEIGLRLVGIGPLGQGAAGEHRTSPHPDEFMARAHEEGWLPWPSSVSRTDGIDEHPQGYVELRSNNCGFREDDDTPVKKPAGTYRIMVTGDSHTDGVVFNSESYANVLERALNDDGENRRFDVINAGFGRSSPYQQLWAYEQALREFQPDALVVGYYAGNDLLELMRRDDRVHLERKGDVFVHAPPRAETDVTAATPGPWERTKVVLRNHLAIYAALSRVALLRRLARGAAGDDYREQLERAQDESSAATWQGLNQAYYFQHHPERWEQDAVPMLRHVLREFRNRTGNDACHFVLLVIPTLRQIEPDYDAAALQSAAKTLQLDEEALACDERACDLAVELARSLQIPFIDLREPFREALRTAPDTHLYYRFDHHLNVEGHRLIAQLLERYFRKLPDLSPRDPGATESKRN